MGQSCDISLSMYPVENIYTGSDHSFGIKHARLLQHCWRILQTLPFRCNQIKLLHQSKASADVPCHCPIMVKEIKQLAVAAEIMLSFKSKCSSPLSFINYA